MNLQHPLAKAKGHGSAGGGTHHWWQQRLTAILLIPLVIWLLIVIPHLLEGGYGAALNMLKNPVNIGFALALVWVMFYHIKLGLQIVVEDYVHTPWLEVTLQVGISIFTLAGGICGSLAILMIAFGG